MIRTLVITAALTALLGFAVGWLAFSKTDTPAGETPDAHAVAGETKAPGKPAPDATGTVVALQRFALGTADAALDRETPAVAVAPDEAVVLAWASQAKADAPARTLYLARSADGGTTFESPVAWRSVPICRYASGNPAKGRKLMYSTHVLPRLVATGDALALGWVEAIDGGPTVRYLIARSRDGGKTFEPPVASHGKSSARPGFTTLAAIPGGGLTCGWIDARNGTPQPYFSLQPAASEGFAPERLVLDGPDSKGICPCCDVAVAVADPAGRRAFVAFRNSDAGHRDIWLARTVADAGASFEPPVPVSGHRWALDGCPHDGPSLAIVGDRLHVAWMDAHDGRSRVYHAESGVDALDFDARPLAPAAHGAQGHPRIAAGPGGSLHAVWDEGLGPESPVPKSAGEHGHHQHASAPSGGAGRAIVYAVSRDGGKTFTPGHVLVPSPGAYQLQPSIAVAADGTVYVAWNEIDQDGKHVVLARLAAK
jgi:hypothetical protein